MQVINVVVVEAGVIQRIDSFVAIDDRNTSVAREAEELFKQKMIEICPDISDEDLGICLDNGVYYEETGNYREISIVHSTMVKVG